MFNVIAPISLPKFCFCLRSKIENENGEVTAEIIHLRRDKIMAMGDLAAADRHLARKEGEALRG